MLAIDSGAAMDAAATSLVQQQYGQFPLSFEANQGQTDSQVDFLARGNGYALFLTDTGAVFDLRQNAAPSTSADRPNAADANVAAGTVIRMQFAGANADPVVTGVDRQQTLSNYFVGGDSSQWQTGIANFSRVKYQDLYAGIDAVFYGNQRQMEYDFNIAPGADPGQIQWQIDGADGLGIDDAGNLLIHTAGSDLVEKAPAIYQEVNGQRCRLPDVSC